MYNTELFKSAEEAEQERIEKYKNYLIEKGFRVEDPPESTKFIISSTDELVDFFYSKMSLKHKELKFTKTNKIIDRKIMKGFIEYRMKARGINKKRAMCECAEMIEVLFKYEEKLNFKYPITSVGILGQKKFKWVTDRLEEFLLYEELSEREIARQSFYKRLVKKYDLEMREDSSNKEDELRRILAEMEEANGEGR